MHTFNRETSLELTLAGWTVAVAVSALGLIAAPVAAAAESSSQRAEGKSSSYSAVAPPTKRRKARAVPERPSAAKLQGLRSTEDALELKSSVALVIDQDTDEVLFSKNPEAVLPIASITKLMTAMVVVDAEQAMDETLRVARVELDTPKNNRSRLKVGAELSRGELMHLALMSSENRAAYALGAHYPGGMTELVAAMNRKAQALGMQDSHFVEPTGLSSKNQSSARDLAMLVKAAYQHPMLREYSTSPDASVPVGRRMVQFRNTNSLVRSPIWEIGLQKTGYISEAGRCLVMQAQLAGRKLIFVLLDSAGRYSRVGDAERIRRWVNTKLPAPQALPAPTPEAGPALTAAVSEGGGDLGRSGSDSF
jgi:serine-type D-Ala-D-Ala endopeptidase (penicillin-binding protein 7)